MDQKFADQGVGGDAYPGSTPEAQVERQHVNDSYGQDSQFSDHPLAEYKFFFANGELDVSGAHDLDGLRERNNVPAEHNGPTAVGNLIVQDHVAIWEVASNVSLSALVKALKKYTKDGGWDWGGVTDMKGEPLGDPEKLARKRYYMSMNEGHLVLSPSKGRDGVVDVVGRVAAWRGLSVAASALQEFADDHNLRLAEYPGGGAMTDQIKNHSPLGEDLELKNIPGERPEEHELERFHKDRDRTPEGIFNCPSCGRLFHRWHEYMVHRREEEPPGEPVQNGHFPTVEESMSDMPTFFEASWGGFSGDDSMAPEIASNFFYGASRLAEKAPKDMFSDPVPFIYDIELDRIFVGHPGARHGEIEAPAGTKFTPGGIVEGEYQPGGKVVVESQSDTPYSVRHMVGLWYWQHPEFEVTGILMTMPDGKQRKIADAANVLYHVSPIANHESIMTHGLDSMRKVKGGYTWTGDVQGQYLFDKSTAERAAKRDFTKSHIYAVDTSGLNVERDPRMPGAHVVRDPIEPNRIGLHGASDGVVVYHGRSWSELEALRRRGSANIGAYVIGQAAQDPAVHAAWQALEQAGGTVYGVGGVVRDALLGKASKDVDLLVTGLPSEAVDSTLRSLRGRVDLTGKDFGVFRYRQGDAEVEVALPRTEKSTGERRVDFDVQVDHDLPIEKDLERRDFTANAIAVNLATGEMVDPFDGEGDIANKRLRTVHDNSFPEDPTRLVRGLVAHSRHGLHPDPKTMRQMQAHAPDLANESPERIQAELDKLFSSDNPGDAIRLAHKTGMLKYLLPEVEAAWDFNQNNKHHAHKLGEHLLNVLDHTAKETTDPDLRLAALLHDIGKPGSEWIDQDTGESHYYRGNEGQGANHEELGAELAEARMRELRYPVARIKRVQDLVNFHMYPDFSSSRGARKFINRVKDHAHDLILLREADRSGKGTDEYQATKTPTQVQRELVEQVRAAGEPTDRAGLAINGNDLMGLGLQPGPAFSQILQALTDLVLEHPELNDKHTLLNHVRHELMPSV